MKMVNEMKNNSSKSNEKRLESLKTLKKNYQNQKSIIQSALSNIDKVSNKIIFDEDLGEELADLPKKDTVKQGQSLFEDDSDDDRFEGDFSVKTQFEGEKGQKLLELQSHYKNDKRFILNERFLEDPVEEQIIENGFNQNEEISLEKEKKREFEILDQVLQEHQIKPKIKEKKMEGEKIFMVRFDPSQPQHSKYEIKKDELHGKKSKNDKTKKGAEIIETKKSEETEVPEVSKNVFYQVKGNLKDTLHTNNQVSLLSMFGNANENGSDAMDQEEEEKEIKITKSILPNEKNPFRYDSSDEDENDVSNKEEPQPVNGISENEEVPNNRTNFWVETFFFKEDDYRLQEGFDFIEKMKNEDSSEFSKSRRELKEIVKIKIRNVQQKKKPFKRKLGGSRRRKDIKLKKALKK